MNMGKEKIEEKDVRLLRYAVEHDGKKEKKPLRAEWLVHELTDAGKEV